jgi:hypothetical protein
MGEATGRRSTGRRLALTKSYIFELEARHLVVATNALKSLRSLAHRTVGQSYARRSWRSGIFQIPLPALTSFTIWLRRRLARVLKIPTKLAGAPSPSGNQPTKVAHDW